MFEFLLILPSGCAAPSPLMLGERRVTDDGEFAELGVG